MIRATALTALMSLFLATECAAISVVVEKYSDAACGQALGTLNAVVMGGTPPYTHNGAMVLPRSTSNSFLQECIP
ncbi:MAG: hypothetical protein IPO56_15795 [Flavobacteriales bacterium]|nr:hypothetical protein [Flavobacteriales bacterium]